MRICAATTLFASGRPRRGCSLTGCCSAAIRLLLIWRPRPRERPRLLLLCLASASPWREYFCFYEALGPGSPWDRVTFEFAAPCWSTASSRRPSDLVWVACAAIGVLPPDAAIRIGDAAGSASPSSPGGSGPPTSCSRSESPGLIAGGLGLALAMGVAAIHGRARNARRGRGPIDPRRGRGAVDAWCSAR